jgi:hypothetical protein
VSTTDRNYELYAASEDELRLWQQAFKWITEMNSFYAFLLLQDEFFQNMNRLVLAFQILELEQ